MAPGVMEYLEQSRMPSALKRAEAKERGEAGNERRLEAPYVQATAHSAFAQAFSGNDDAP
jgi:hypothetical protein